MNPQACWNTLCSLPNKMAASRRLFVCLLHSHACLAAVLMPTHLTTFTTSTSLLASILNPFDLRAPAGQYSRNLFGGLDRRVVCLHPSGPAFVFCLFHATCQVKVNVTVCLLCQSTEDDQASAKATSDLLLHIRTMRFTSRSEVFSRHCLNDLHFQFSVCVSLSPALCARVCVCVLGRVRVCVRTCLGLFSYHK